MPLVLRCISRTAAVQPGDSSHCKDPCKIPTHPVLTATFPIPIRIFNCRRKSLGSPAQRCARPLARRIESPSCRLLSAEVIYGKLHIHVSTRST